MPLNRRGWSLRPRSHLAGGQERAAGSPLAVGSGCLAGSPRPLGTALVSASPVSEPHGAQDLGVGAMDSRE